MFIFTYAVVTGAMMNVPKPVKKMAFLSALEISKKYSIYMLIIKK